VRLRIRAASLTETKIGCIWDTWLPSCVVTMCAVVWNTLAHFRTDASRNTLDRAK
jgi:hypothetical protein